MNVCEETGKKRVTSRPKLFVLRGLLIGDHRLVHLCNMILHDNQQMKYLLFCLHLITYRLLKVMTSSVSSPIHHKLTSRLGRRASGPGAYHKGTKLRLAPEYSRGGGRNAEFQTQQLGNISIKLRPNAPLFPGGNLQADISGHVGTVLTK